jgi:hypothetical protein
MGCSLAALVEASHAAQIDVTACDLAGNVVVAGQALPAR